MKIPFGADPRSGRPSITRNEGIIGEGSRPHPGPYRQPAPFGPFSFILPSPLYRVADPGESPKLYLFGQLEADYQTMA